MINKRQRIIEVLTTAMEKPEIANALIQRVINELNKGWVSLTEEETNVLIQKWSGELVFEVTQALKEKNGA